MRPTPDDYAEAWRLLAPAAFGGTAAAGLTAGYQHDHDVELGTWDNHPSPNPPANTRNVAGVSKAFDRPRHRRPRDEAYWNETARLLMDYFELQAGALYSETLYEGFVAWLERSPAEFRRYENGDDMTRAVLVDWFLRVVR
jgi:hypothetical protein